MTQPRTTPYEQFSERLRHLVAVRDAALTAVHSSYAQALASGSSGDLYSRYLEQRGSVMNKFSLDAIALRKEYAEQAPADAAPLPDSPSPVPAFPRPKQPAEEESSTAPPAIQSSLQMAAPAILAQPSHKPRPRWRLISGIVVIGAVVMVVANLISTSNRTTSSSSYTSTVSSTSEVLYEVEGTATSVDITMETPSGTSQGANKKVPLANKETGKRGISLTMERGDFVYISAQNQGSSGTLTCKISVDGVVIAKVTSSGAYTIASCKGTVP